jgi:acyl-CoA synthetase
VCAVVELHPGRALALEELVAHLRAQGMSVESWPERLLVLDELPRSSGGKIAKGELREIAARRLGAQGREAAAQRGEAERSVGPRKGVERT